MKTYSIHGKVIKVYDSIDEMPIINFQKYNKYILLDSGLGSDLNSIDSHIVNLARLINTDQKKAIQELQNLRQTMFLIINELSPKYMAFASLIYSVDGKKIENLSDDNLKEVLFQIKEVPHSLIYDFLEWFKKKLTTELETYFPSDFCSPKEKEVYDRLKQRTALVLDGITNDKDNSESIHEIDAYLFSLYKPKSFSGSTSIEIQYDKQFETTCMLISQKTGLVAKKMTVLEFYNTLGNIEKQAEAELKACNKYKHK